MRRIDLPIRHPKDIFKLRESIPQLMDYDEYAIQSLYHEFSEESMCASWLLMDSVNGYYLRRLRLNA